MGYGAPPQYMVPAQPPVWDKHPVNHFSGYVQRCPTEPNRTVQTPYANEGLLIAPQFRKIYATFNVHLCPLLSLCY